jgi:hypothetical protein
MRRVALLFLSVALGVAFVPAAGDAHVDCLGLSVSPPVLHCGTQNRLFVGVQDLGNCVGVVWDYYPTHTPDLVVEGPVCPAH